MRRALLTGATGGFGATLATGLLEAGYILRATGRDVQAGARLAAIGSEFVPADITDPAAPSRLCEGVDVVFHAAALSSPWGRPSDFEAINLQATKALLRAARAAGCDAFVFISTPSVYAEPRDRLGLTEASPLARRFANAYVATKYAAEQKVLAAGADGFSTIALRPRALVGPHDRQLLPRLLRVAARGRFPLLRGGRALIELTDARDAADAVIRADQRRLGLSGEVFNLSGGAPRPVAEILRLAFAAAGVAPRLTPVPYALAAAACRMAEAVCAALPGRPEPPATVYSLSTLAFSQTFDLAKAREMLDWRPMRSPEEAIAHAAPNGASHASL